MPLFDIGPLNIGDGPMFYERGCPNCAKLEAERDRLRETLRWYANPENYKDGRPGHWFEEDLPSGGTFSNWAADRGGRARVTLGGR